MRSKIVFIDVYIFISHIDQKALQKKTTLLTYNHKEINVTCSISMNMLTKRIITQRRQKRFVSYVRLLKK